jgi:hypothetical protein
VTPGPPAARVRAGVAAIPYASSAVWSCTRGVHVVVERRSIVSSGADYTRRPRLIPRDAHRLASSHTLMSRHVRSHSHAFPPLAARAMQGREETRNPRNSRQNDHSTGTIIIPRSIATPSGSGNPAGTSISLARYSTRQLSSQQRDRRIHRSWEIYLPRMSLQMHVRVAAPLAMLRTSCVAGLTPPLLHCYIIVHATYTTAVCLFFFWNPLLYACALSKITCSATCWD